MRLLLAAILALALGLLPVGAARAQNAAVPSTSAMSCHDQGGGDHDMSGGEMPTDDMRDCADHCLSQVNVQTTLVRLPGPSLLNAIRAELGGTIDLGKLHYRDPPDPPPPRI